MSRTGIRASALIIRENKILLVHRKENGQEYWTFPGGGVEDGETWEEAVIREVKEETSLDVLSTKKAFMNQTFEGGNDHPFYFCEVKDGEAILGGEEKKRNSEQNFYQLEWIPIEGVGETNLVPETAKEKVLAKLFT